MDFFHNFLDMSSYCQKLGYLYLAFIADKSMANLVKGPL